MKKIDPNTRPDVMKKAPSDLSLTELDKAMKWIESRFEHKDGDVTSKMEFYYQTFRDERQYRRILCLTRIIGAMTLANVGFILIQVFGFA